MIRQLPLDLRWPAHQRFESFVALENAPAVSALRSSVSAADGDWQYLCGPLGSGKTHLLIAACAAAAEAGRRAQYFDLRDSRRTAIRSFGGSDVLALDDIDALAGDSDAEHALFDLYNRCRAERATLLFSASVLPAAVGFGLADLVSRISTCTQWTLRPLDETARREVLRQRASARGLVLDDAVLDWLFTHHARNLVALTALLERIDTAALAAQRRITVPFLRSLLT